MFAHQGGWDEILLVLGPMVVIVVLLRLAKRRVERMGPRIEQDPPTTHSPTERAATPGEVSRDEP